MIDTLIDKLMVILAMSGYAQYIWSAFGIAVVTLALLQLHNRKKLDKAIAEHEQLLQDVAHCAHSAHSDSDKRRQR